MLIPLILFLPPYLHSTSPPHSPTFLSSVILTVTSVAFLCFGFSCSFTSYFLLYKVFKILLFVLYDVSMVMFFIKEEEKFIFVTGLFHNSFLNWYCKISMQELLSGAFLFKNVICVINGRICSLLSCLLFCQRANGHWPRGSGDWDQTAGVTPHWTFSLILSTL